MSVGQPGLARASLAGVCIHEAEEGFDSIIHGQLCLCCTVTDQWYVTAIEPVCQVADMLPGKVTETQAWMVPPSESQAVPGGCSQLKHGCIASVSHRQC